MLIKEFLEKVCDEIKYKPIRNDISEELNLHIQEMKGDYIDCGLSEIEAEEKAVSNMGDGVLIGKKLNRIHKPKFDWILFWVVLILIGFGVLVSTINWNFYREVKFLILGSILSVLIYFSNYKKILKYSNIIYILTTFILIFTFMCGGRVNTSVRYIYINIGALKLNPIFVSVYMYIISFVGFLTNFDRDKKIEMNIGEINLKVNKDFVKTVSLAIVSIILIIINNSLTMAVLLSLAYIIITTFYIINSKENVGKKIIKLYGIVLVGIIFICLLRIDMFYMMIERLKTFFNGDLDPRGNGYMEVQIGKTLEQANLYGKQNGENNIQKLIDEGTNYALISIVSNYGLIIAGAIVLAIIALCIRLIISSKKIKDRYGKLLVIGVSTIILLQAFFNILMNFNLIIGVDIGLPFVSYGGTGLLLNMMSIAFILSIYRRKDILIKDDEKKKLKISFEVKYE